MTRAAIAVELVKCGEFPVAAARMPEIAAPGGKLPWQIRKKITIQ